MVLTLINTKAHMELGMVVVTSTDAKAHSELGIVVRTMTENVGAN